MNAQEGTGMIRFAIISFGGIVARGLRAGDAGAIGAFDVPEAPRQRTAKTEAAVPASAAAP
jgi:hypothetical protein